MHWLELLASEALQRPAVQLLQKGPPAVRRPVEKVPAEQEEQTDSPVVEV